MRIVPSSGPRRYLRAAHRLGDGGEDLTALATGIGCPPWLRSRRLGARSSRRAQTVASSCWIAAVTADCETLKVDRRPG